MKVVASRGRLRSRIAAWDDELRDEYTRMCADRAHELAASGSPPLDEWDAVIEPSVPERPGRRRWHESLRRGQRSPSAQGLDQTGDARL